MEKVYNRIIWKNGEAPALSASNLNAMSKALDEIDERVANIADAENVLARSEEIVNAAKQAEEAAKRAQAVSNVDVASSTRAGLVRPDGATIQLSAGGDINVNTANEATDEANTTYRTAVVYGETELLENERTYAFENSEEITFANEPAENGFYKAPILKRVIENVNKRIDDGIQRLFSAVSVMIADAMQQTGGIRLVREGTLNGGNANEANNTAVMIDLELDSNYVFTYDSWLVANNTYRGQESFMISTSHVGSTASNVSLANVHRFSAGGTTGITYAMNRRKVGDLYYPAFGFGTCGTGAAVHYKCIKLL